MKLKKEIFHYSDKESRKSFELQIHVSQSDGKFYFYQSEIPTHIWTAAQDMFRDRLKDTQIIRRRVLETKDLNYLRKAVYEGIEEFEKTLREKETRTVIAYQFKLQGVLIPEIRNDEEEIIQEELSFDQIDSWNKGGLGLLLEWQVLTETRVGGELYYIDKEDHRTDPGDDAKIIAHTAQVEEWFIGLEASLKKMLANIHEFNQQSAADLFKAIQNGKGTGFLLTGRAQ